MRIQDLHVLPKFSDGWSYLYVEHCGVDQEDRAIAVHDKSGKVPVPCANLALLMLGPGVSITHAAISMLADHGCLVAWCGEEGVRFYALGMGETRSAANFLHQARVWAHPGYRMEVVRRMYQLRFSEKFDAALDPSANPRHGGGTRARRLRPHRQGDRRRLVGTKLSARRVEQGRPGEPGLVHRQFLPVRHLPCRHRFGRFLPRPGIYPYRQDAVLRLRRRRPL